MQLVTGVDLQLNTPTLESWFTHIPGLKAVAQNPADMKGLLKSSIRDNSSDHSEYKSEFNQKGEVPVDPDYTIPLGVGEIKT